MLTLNRDLKPVHFDNAACSDYLAKNQQGDLARIFSDYIKKGEGRFASDVCRAYYLYKEGGFYLDNDVELIKPLSELVEPETTFMSVWESQPVKDSFYTLRGGVLNAVMGAAPGSKIIG